MKKLINLMHPVSFHKDDEDTGTTGLHNTQQPHSVSVVRIRTYFYVYKKTACNTVYVFLFSKQQPTLLTLFSMF